MATIEVPADFTLSDLRAFIEGEGEEAPEGFYTVAEWADRLSLNEQTVRRYMRKAKAKGMLERVVVRRETIHGRLWPVPAYAFKAREGG